MLYTVLFWMFSLFSLNLSFLWWDRWVGLTKTNYRYRYRRYFWSWYRYRKSAILLRISLISLLVSSRLVMQRLVYILALNMSSDKMIDGFPLSTAVGRSFTVYFRHGCFSLKKWPVSWLEGVDVWRQRYKCSCNCLLARRSIIYGWRYWDGIGRYSLLGLLYRL